MLTNARRRPWLTGRPGVLSDRGALAAGAILDVRPLRVPAVILGVVLAWVASLGPAVLLARARRRHSLASRGGSPSYSVRVPIGLVPAALRIVAESDRSFWSVRRGVWVVTRGGHIQGTFGAAGGWVPCGQGNRW